MSFQELLQVDSRATLRFFCLELKKEISTEKVADAETLYVASVLASYAQTSRGDTTSIPPFASPSEIFDHFVFLQEELRDPELLEIAGAQSLFLVGFFRDQMRHRHNVRWYDDLGQSFYRRAGQYSRNSKKRELFGGISDNFPVWTKVCRNLNRSFQENRFLLLSP